MSMDDPPQGSPPGPPAPPPSAPPDPPSPPPAAPPPPGVPPEQPPPQPPPGEAGGGGGTSENRGLMLVLSYLGILALIPLLVEKEDAEVQWHAKHGLVLTVAEFVVFVVLFVANFAIAAATGLGCIGCVLYPVLSLGILVLHVMCMVKAINGERLLIPGLSEYADKF